MARPKKEDFKTSAWQGRANISGGTSLAFVTKSSQEKDKVIQKVASGLNEDLTRGRLMRSKNITTYGNRYKRFLQGIFEQELHSDLIFTDGEFDVPAHLFIVQARARGFWLESYISGTSDINGRTVKTINLHGITEIQTKDFVRQLYSVTESGLLFKEFSHHFGQAKRQLIDSSLSNEATDNSSAGTSLCPTADDVDAISTNDAFDNENNQNAISSNDDQVCDCENEVNCFNSSSSLLSNVGNVSDLVKDAIQDSTISHCDENVELRATSENLGCDPMGASCNGDIFGESSSTVNVASRDLMAEKAGHASSFTDTHIVSDSSNNASSDSGPLKNREGLEEKDSSKQEITSNTNGNDENETDIMKENDPGMEANKYHVEDGLKNELPSVPYDTCSALGTDLLHFYLQKLHCDICLSVEGVHFLAHKCVLSSRSPYFSAMFGGRWSESSLDVVQLEGVSASAFEKVLLFFYGGVIDCISMNDIPDLFVVADMYGVETMRIVIQLFIRRDMCHFFHKPCATCTALAPDALNLCCSYFLEELQDRLLKWISKHFTKIWSTKAFASQTDTLHQLCVRAIASEMTEINVLDTIMSCEKLATSLPRIKWTECILCLTTQLMDSAMEYTSANFVKVVKAPEFLAWAKVASWKASALEEIFNSVIDSLPVEIAISVYQTLIDLRSNEDAIELPEQNLLDLLNVMIERCERFLRTHIHQVARSSQWSMISKSFKSKILENSSYIHLDQFPDAKPRPIRKPVLSSSVAKSKQPRPKPPPPIAGSNSNATLSSLSSASKSKPVKTALSKQASKQARGKTVAATNKPALKQSKASPSNRNNSSSGDSASSKVLSAESAVGAGISIVAQTERLSLQDGDLTSTSHLDSSCSSNSCNSKIEKSQNDLDNTEGHAKKSFVGFPRNVSPSIFSRLNNQILKFGSSSPIGIRSPRNLSPAGSSMGMRSPRSMSPKTGFSMGIRSQRSLSPKVESNKPSTVLGKSPPSRIPLKVLGTDASGDEKSGNRIHSNENIQLYGASGDDGEVSKVCGDTPSSNLNGEKNSLDSEKLKHEQSQSQCDYSIMENGLVSNSALTDMNLCDLKPINNDDNSNVFQSNDNDTGLQTLSSISVSNSECSSNAVVKKSELKSNTSCISYIDDDDNCDLNSDGNRNNCDHDGGGDAINGSVCAAIDMNADDDVCAQVVQVETNFIRRNQPVKMNFVLPTSP